LQLHTSSKGLEPFVVKFRFAIFYFDCFHPTKVRYSRSLSIGTNAASPNTF
jgi:hypothetical protein